jgi:hypothetical protein
MRFIGNKENLVEEKASKEVVNYLQNEKLAELEIIKHIISL